MRVLLDIRGVVEVPDDTNLRAFAMTLQDSRAVLDAHLDKADYEVIVHSAPKHSPQDDGDS